MNRINKLNKGFNKYSVAYQVQKNKRKAILIEYIGGFITMLLVGGIAYFALLIS